MVDGYGAARQRNTVTGELRVVCLMCPWTSPPTKDEWVADMQAQSHVESMHGVELGPYREERGS